MSLVPNMVLVFKLNGERKELNYRKLPFAAWSELKRELGFTPATLLTAMGDYDLEAIGACVWLERKQRERTLRWGEVRRDLEREDVDFEPLGTIIDGVSDIPDDESNATETEGDPTSAG